MENENNSNSALFLAFTSISFIIALTMGINTFRTVAETNEITNQMINQNDRSITANLQIPTMYTVSGEEVRQSIYQIEDIGVDITVQGVLFPKDLDPLNVNLSGISLSKLYVPTYDRDTLGNLTSVRFQLKEE